MTEFFIFNFLPIVVVECIILRLVKWGNFWTCLLDSLLMNFASFFCMMLGIAPPIQSYQAVGMLLYFTYSFLVEGFVLCLLERNTVRKALLAAAAANFVSVMYLAIDASVSVPPTTNRKDQSACTPRERGRPVSIDNVLAIISK
jgi:hypothetical protein